MQDNDIHLANNHLKGTEFDCAPSSPDAPIRRGVITIDKCVLRLAVFPEKVSRSGNRFCPIRLQYGSDSRYVLRAVPLGQERP